MIAQYSVDFDLYGFSIVKFISPTSLPKNDDWEKAVADVEEGLGKVFVQEDLTEALSKWEEDHEDLKTVTDKSTTTEWVVFGSMEGINKGEEQEMAKMQKAGAEGNPFDLDWPKPASAEYPTLYFGGRSKKVISQDELQGKVGEEVNGHEVEEFTPHGKATLAGGEEIGLDSRFHLSAGTIVGPLSDEATPGGGKINNILKKYGFSPSGEGLDGDHVWEIQFGGEDDLDNLWPLDSGQNRGAGSSLAQRTVNHPQSSEGVKVSDLKDHVSSNNFYFKQEQKYRAKSTDEIEEHFQICLQYILIVPTYFLFDRI